MSEKAFAKSMLFLNLVPMRKINEANRWLFPGRLGAVKKVKLLLVGLAVLAVMTTPRAMAGTEMKQVPADSCSAPCCGDAKDWSLELGSGAFWSNVRSGLPNQAYTVVPISLTASLKLDDVSLDHFLGGWLRGYSEFYFRGDYDQIVHGPENHYEGLLVGPRYNFVQPGWKIVPYVEGGVGFDFADSNPAAGGLGQDFNFTFDVGAGAKYNICNDFYVRLGVEYQHISNAGLSEPTNPNHPIDGLGPKLSFGYSF
jgi:opacity protein-like surface antigen